jgi:nitroimidazol reductase NimA-like FMN-containing flavoprotein (pyridoxamine 5'-phosphate oxidase superfamily)
VTEPPSDRIRVRRNAKKGRYERERIHSILDRSLVAHVAFIDRGEPVCIPMLHARVEEKISIHGSRASRAMRLLAAGAPACLTVTLLDGLVLPRSAFEHSANYESVVAFGRFEEVTGDDERLAALVAFTNKLLPRRWHVVRQPNTNKSRPPRSWPSPSTRHRPRCAAARPTTTPSTMPTSMCGRRAPDHPLVRRAGTLARFATRNRARHEPQSRLEQSATTRETR